MGMVEGRQGARLDAGRRFGASSAAMTVAAQPDKPVETPASEQQAQGWKDKAGAIADDFFSKTGAAEPAADQPAADGTTPSQPAAEQPAQTPPAETWVAPTAEQLSSTAWWGALDKAGVERATKEFPVAAAHWKAGQAAGTRYLNERRAEGEQIIANAKAEADRILKGGSTTTRTEAQPDDEPSPELLALMEEYDAEFDPAKRARLLVKIQRLTAPDIAREIGFDPAAAKAERVQAEALKAAVQQSSDLATFMRSEEDRIALDKIADDSPALSHLISIGTADAIAVAMVEAAKVLSERKRVAAEQAKATADAAEAARKEKERQQVVQSNARPASADVLQQHGATQPGAVPLRQRLGDRFDQLTRSNT